MENIWSLNNIRRLFSLAKAAEESGDSLSKVFTLLASELNCSVGSVRNYYYSQAKLFKMMPALAAEMGIEQAITRARPFVTFDPEEAEAILVNALINKAKGKSVRATITEMAGGDKKIALRYQNKYRNMLKKQPERIEETAKNMGLENVVVQKNGQGRGKDFLERRLEKEINELYDRLALSLKNENERLKETLRQLNEENELLRRAARAVGKQARVTA